MHVCLLRHCRLLPIDLRTVVGEIIRFRKSPLKHLARGQRHHLSCKEVNAVRPEQRVDKEGDGLFDVTMGCFDGAEICELVGTFALATLTDEFKEGNIGHGLFMCIALVAERSRPGRGSWPD